ncbi:Nodal modulator 2 [Holothuria leucospilota]|uniref:Nodal modulator 2 n=1 Tax=Holothuria leucospilota TaxID=206669 RepID=A0A9Q1BY92_HOLLE|nr:Nodal modulator 2 [Holothuria leucospilota]
MPCWLNIILLLLSQLGLLAIADDFITCGGFVQSDIEINFSRIEVKLYTPQGALKYQTDCAPNNGYFMVPIYDKGSFLLKLEPPKGWLFEPSSVNLDIDGETDKCSLGQDINFRFTGFTVRGKVINKGQTEGPSGVTVSIQKQSTKEQIAEVMSQERGIFQATNIFPGDYLLTAKHPKWKFIEASFPITISKDITTIDKPVEVKGYDINGRVESEKEPIRDVFFILFSDTVQKEDVSECDKSPVPGFKNPTNKVPLCFVQSNQDGIFTFPSVPASTYKVVPFYQGEHITFDVLPSSLDVSVTFDSVQVPTTFRVEGFSVSGRVLTSAEGVGIAGVTVSVKGKKDVTTSADGTYQLEKIKSGTYTLTAQAEHVFFEPATVKITPNTPKLPDILAAKFSLCGKVEVDTKGGLTLNKRRVLLNPAKQGNVEAVSTSTDTKGGFCFQVKPGQYVVTPVVADMEREKGLKLIPSSQNVKITDQPKVDVNFAQFKAQVSGSVSCIGKCGQLEVILTPEGSTGGAKTLKLNHESKMASFQVQNVLPGKYQATILQGQWCWEKETLDVHVTDKDIGGLTFKQTGYQMLCETTHPATLKYSLQKSSQVSGTMDLTTGTSSVCLDKPGIYKLTTESCHKFEKDQYTFDTASSNPVSLIAIKHQIKGRITAKEAATDIIVKVRSGESNQETDVTPTLISPISDAKKQKDGNQTKEKSTPPPPQGPFIYEFAYFASNGDVLTITPVSKEILFYPPETEVTVKVGESCPGVITEFEGRPGKFISGTIEPPLAGVIITLTHIPAADEDRRAPVEVLSDKKGQYRVGPLPDTAEYTISASFEGYALMKLPDDPASFKAKKLGEITISVRDESGNPLSGVLLSLSGGSFRSNNLTEASGKLFFSKLEPHQYFLRTLMKEFEFTPKTQMIDVTEGASLSIEVIGHRVAFSCFGQVTSLNGEPEPGVALEAVGASNCGEFVEEGVSDQEGNFRIRGLQPNCDYKLQLKKTEANDHIVRATPATQIIQVKDGIIKNLNVIVFRQIKQFDLAGNVVVNNEFLPTLKVKLFQEDNPDSPVHTVSLGSSSFFQFPPLAKDNMRYRVKLESSLSKSTYSFVLPEASFSTADGYFKHITLPFTPQRKSVEQEIAQGSYLALPLIVAAVVVVFNHSKILPLITQKFQQLLKPTGRGGVPAAPVPSAPPPIDMSFFPPEENIKQKKKPKVRKA